MKKYHISEIFKSIEGEGPYSGHPTVYIRFAGCNFTCLGFNNPNMEPTTNENLGFNPADYSTLESLPVISFGCDSLYAHDKRFKHLWKQYSIDELAKETSKLAVNWVHPISNLPVILSLTGGEPTLHWKMIPELLNHPLYDNLKIVLIETNCSVNLSDEFIDAISKWQSLDIERRVVWSNSPKLHNSGELHHKAIIPQVALKQLRCMSEQYFKFVCGPNDPSYEEVESVMEEYYAVGIDRSTPIYIMPEACLEEQQQHIAVKVANQCMSRGYVYCHRIQNSVFGNLVGT